jgi:nucleoside-diphosphate-sugar epimerase
VRVFLTGGTGYVGGAVAGALRSHGHEVAALVRPEAEQRRLRDLGAFIVSGDLSTLPSLIKTLESYDVFVHAAQSKQDAVELDRIAVDVFTSLGKHFVYTSGVWVLGNTDGADETSPVNPLQIVAWRPAHEERALGAGGSVVRPGCVYGGKQSLLADWFAAVDAKRPISVVGDGRNRWAMVNLADLADCYARVVENRKAGVFHAIDDTQETIEECARALAPDARIEKTPVDAARKKLGPFVDALIVNQRIKSERTRRALGWTPNRTFTSSVDEQWREWRSA